MVFTLIYISSASSAMSEQDLADILSVSRSNNSQTSITGMLLYKNGEFMQALEGNRDDVEKLYEIISQDNRHKDSLVLSRKEIPERSFAEWSMGFKNISAMSHEGLIDPDSFFSAKNDFNQGQTALNFLSSFYKS
jgi:hypothetical protein